MSNFAACTSPEKKRTERTEGRFQRAMKRSHGDMRNVSRTSLPRVGASLPGELLGAWQAQLDNADSKDACAHWWADPHWLRLGTLDGGRLIERTLMHLHDHAFSPSEWESFHGCEFWTQRCVALLKRLAYLRVWHNATQPCGVEVEHLAPSQTCPVR